MRRGEGQDIDLRLPRNHTGRAGLAREVEDKKQSSNTKVKRRIIF